MPHAALAVKNSFYTRRKICSKLKKVEEKFDFISAELCKSEVVSDMELYKNICRSSSTYHP